MLILPSRRIESESHRRRRTAFGLGLADVGDVLRLRDRNARAMQVGALGSAAMQVGALGSAAMANGNSLLNGLQVYFKLGNLTDSNGAVTDLTNNSATFVNGGKQGSTASFVSASSSYLSHPSATALQMGNIDCTIDCWVMLTNKTLMGLVCKDTGATSADEWRLVYNPGSDRFRFVVSNGAISGDGVNADNFGSPALNTWYYIRAWRDKTQNKVFIAVNEGTPNSVTETITPGTNNTEFRIGSTADNNNYANALICEFGKWNRLLTTSEAATRYNNGFGNTYPFSTYAMPDIFVVAGQSNAGGRATNNQIYTGTVPSYLFANDYNLKYIYDPTDDTTNQVDAVSKDADSPTGSAWTLVANSLTARTGRPCLFVPCALTGSSISQWQPGANHQDRTTLYGSMIYRTNQIKALGTLRLVLWQQGEFDARDDIETAQATYRAELQAIADAAAGDITGLKLMPCLLQHMTDAAHSLDYRTTINAAINAAVAADPNNLVNGPDFSDITPSVDGLHFKTDAEVSTQATRWANAIILALGW